MIDKRWTNNYWITITICYFTVLNTAKSNTDFLEYKIIDIYEPAYRQRVRRAM